MGNEDRFRFIVGLDGLKRTVVGRICILLFHSSFIVLSVINYAFWVFFYSHTTSSIINCRHRHKVSVELKFYVGFCKWISACVWLRSNSRSSSKCCSLVLRWTRFSKDTERQGARETHKMKLSTKCSERIEIHIHTMHTYIYAHTWQIFTCMQNVLMTGAMKSTERRNNYDEKKNMSAKGH